MKILGTVSRRSKGKIFIELFQFRGLLMVWELGIFYEARSVFATREGKRCTKGSVHPVRHPRVQLGERASAQARESFARQNGQNGRGTAPSWAGATPLFRLSSAQKVHGVAPARYTGSVTAFCLRAQRELLRRTSETIFPLATHCSRIELNRRAEGKRLFSQRHKWPITRNHKLTRHTLRRTQLGSVDADFLHRVTGAASFLRALLNSRGEERFTPVLHGALHRPLHPSAAGKTRQVNPINVLKTVGLRRGSHHVRTRT